MNGGRPDFAPVACVRRQPAAGCIHVAGQDRGITRSVTESQTIGVHQPAVFKAQPVHQRTRTEVVDPLDYLYRFGYLGISARQWIAHAPRHQFLALIDLAVKLVTRGTLLLLTEEFLGDRRFSLEERLPGIFTRQEGDYQPRIRGTATRTLVAPPLVFQSRPLHHVTD